MYRSNITPEALAVFQDAKKHIAEANEMDFGRCWLWPSSWPSDWPPLPQGYSTSIMGEGYGQFHYPGAPWQPYAHVLSYETTYQLTDKDLDELDPEGLGTENRHDLRSSDHIRHAEGCSKRCINPVHLRRGNRSYNILDNNLDKIRVGKIGARAERISQELLRLWHPPGGYKEFAEHFGIAQWEVVSILYHKGGHDLDRLLTDNEPR